MERIYIHVAAKEICYKDRRSFKKWCSNNGVGILSDNGSKKLYVIKEEFEEAKSKKATDYLKQKEMRFKKRDGYKPKGEHEKKFLSILTGTNPEL
ncbi:MAG TPA: hypothetical protein VI757_10505 [Bacteroidia bacterium]|nr:hypothetical protein [Bacteroidia bacterium]